MARYKWDHVYDKENGYYYSKLLCGIYGDRSINVAIIPANEQFLIIGDISLNGTYFFDSLDAENAVMEVITK